MIRSDVLGVVLTGGRSSRMGHDKAALPHPDGGTFADHAISRLQEVCRRIVIAGSAPPWGGLASADRSPGGPAADGSITVIPDPAVHLGPVTGIVEALHACRAAGAIAALVTPVDMPYLNAAELRSLVEAADETLTEYPPQPILATFDGVHREPLVAIYPVESLGSLEQLAASSDRSLNRWLGSQPHRLLRLPSAAAANINTPDEYRELVQETDPGEPAPRPRKQPDR